MQHHIILTNGRSGSNYFANLLNLHPQVTNYGEVLGEWTLTYKLYNNLPLVKKNDYRSYLDYIYNSKSFFYLGQLYSAYAKISRKTKPNLKYYNQVKHVGIKDFSINFKKRNILKYLQERDIAVINLYRENVLKRFISLESMKKTQVVAVRNKSEQKKSTEKVYIPVAEMMPQLDLFHQEKEEQFAMIAGLPENKVVNIAYEDYFSSSENQAEYNKRIFELLGVDQLSLQSSFRKILPNKLVDLVENYQEVVEALENTKYEKYLNN